MHPEVTMPITLKKWIRRAEGEIKGAERAVDFISKALKSNLEYGKKYTSGLVHYFGEETVKAADESYRLAGREIREAVKQLKSAKWRLEQQAKARRATLAWAKRKLKR
jgi:hypothetical protein